MTTDATSTDRRDVQVMNGQGGEAQVLGLLESARRVADEAVSAARVEAEQLMSAARQRAAQVEREARERSEQRSAQARSEAEKVLHQAHGEADRMLSGAREQLAALERKTERLRSEQATAMETARAMAARLMQAAGTEGDQTDGR